MSALGSADGRPDARPDGGAGRRGKPQPEWREPEELPAVQRARTGTFGDTLAALAEAAQVVQAAMAAIDADGLSDPEIVALTQAVE
jgi:hypothetical protein